VSPDLVHWNEVPPSAIRGGSGAILPLTQKMKADSGGVVAIAFDGGGGGLAFWTTHDEGELHWDPPAGCATAGPPSGKVTCNSSQMDPERPGSWLLPKDVDAGKSIGDPTAAWVSGLQAPSVASVLNLHTDLPFSTLCTCSPNHQINSTDGKLYGVFANMACAKVDGQISQNCTYKQSKGGTYQVS
jgi:hypothetical protein